VKKKKGEDDRKLNAELIGDCGAAMDSFVWSRVKRHLIGGDAPGINPGATWRECATDKPWRYTAQVAGDNRDGP